MSSISMVPIEHEKDKVSEDILDTITTGNIAGSEVVVLEEVRSEPIQMPMVGKVNQVNYTLNDTAALKKKLRHETNRKEPFTSGNDAKDGSNVVVLLKTSFFEHMKMSYLKDLLQMDGITEIGNALGTKASTNQSGDAFVEYALDVRFTASNHTHGVKLTAYPTTCKVMIQPLEKPSVHQHLGNRSVPRYFTDVFLLPWCEDAAANKSYNEKDLTDALKAKIVELDLHKVKTSSSKVRLSSVPGGSEAKCVAKSCKYNGLNLNNKMAVGVCSKCGQFEHFECSKTKQEDKELILKGQLSYFCSECFLKNPTSIAFHSKKSSVVSDLTPVTQAKASSPVTPASAFKCSRCNYESSIQEDFDRHSKDPHKFVCETCKILMATKKLLEDHKTEKHGTRRPCDLCEMEFISTAELSTHMKEEHGPKCTTCSHGCHQKFFQGGPNPCADIIY